MELKEEILLEDGDFGGEDDGLDPEKEAPKKEGDQAADGVGDDDEGDDPDIEV